MAPAISDAAIVAILRPFVRASGPLLDGLRDADPFGLAGRLQGGEPDETERKLKDKVLDFVAARRMPGTSAWRRMTPEQRTKWWVDRMGRFTTLVASVPGLGGVWADRLPVSDAVGAASQGLLLCAIAGEYGIDDTGERVRLLAKVLFRRTLSPAVASGRTEDSADEDKRTDELTEDIGAKHSRGISLKAAASAVFKLGKALWSVTDELEKRPRGRWYHRLLGMVPIVGMLADYLGERSALKRAAKQAVRWITSQQTGALSGGN